MAVLKTMSEYRAILASCEIGDFWISHQEAFLYVGGGGWVSLGGDSWVVSNSNLAFAMMAIDSAGDCHKRWWIS